jgi:hypothetical protein
MAWLMDLTVGGQGRLRTLCSRSLMPLAVKPALVANSSCVKPADSLNLRSRAPNGSSVLRLN